MASSKSNATYLEKKLADFKRVLEAINKPLGSFPSDLIKNLLSSTAEDVTKGIQSLVQLCAKAVSRAVRPPAPYAKGELKSPTSPKSPKKAAPSTTPKPPVKADHTAAESDDFKKFNAFGTTAVSAATSSSTSEKRCIRLLKQASMKLHLRQTTTNLVTCLEIALMWET